MFRSRGERWSYKSEAGPFIDEWNRINASVMDANDPRVAVVNYDQLAANPTVFHTLCNFLGIRGENLFHSGRPVEEVESSLSEADVADIRKQTVEQLTRLDAAAAAFLAANSSASTDEEGDGPDPSAAKDGRNPQPSPQRRAERDQSSSCATNVAPALRQSCSASAAACPRRPYSVRVRLVVAQLQDGLRRGLRVVPGHDGAAAGAGVTSSAAGGFGVVTTGRPRAMYSMTLVGIECR